MKNQLLLSIVEEKPGVLSAARVILLLTFVVTIAAPIATVLWNSWGKPEFVKPDPAFLEFCKWSFTAALGGKVGQAIFGEKDTPTPVTPPATQ